jgi:hypothetical protein
LLAIVALAPFFRAAASSSKKSSPRHQRRPKALQNIEKANDLVADALTFGGPCAREYQP